MFITSYQRKGNKTEQIAVYTVPPDDEQISARNMYRLLIVIS
jgi:hypothetical protein